jgi:hypothetical protein
MLPWRSTRIVGGDHAADRGGRARGQVDTEVEPGRARMRLEFLQRHSGTDGHLGLDRVDRLDLGEAGKADQHLATGRNAGTDEPGVAALHHDRRSGCRTRLYDRDHLGRGRGPYDAACGAGETAGPVRLVGCAQVVVDEDVCRPDGRTERVFQAGHDRTRRRMVCSISPSRVSTPSE